MASVKLYPVDNVQFLLTQGADLISSHLRTGKLWEHLTIQIICLFCKEMNRPVFVDIGANLGAISIPIGKFLQDKQGQVHSIEAQRPVFYQLCGNLFANHLSQHCFAYHTAVGNTMGSIQVPVLNSHTTKNIGGLSLDENIRREQGWHSHFEQYETVPLTTLDAMNLPLASIIKIDVEGMEWEVIQGGLGWLTRSQFPPILFEVWGDYMKQQIPKRQKLFRLLENLGYELFLLGDLCIAQHKNNQYIKFDLQQNQLKMSLVPRIQIN